MVVAVSGGFVVLFFAETALPFVVGSNRSWWQSRMLEYLGFGRRLLVHLRCGCASRCKLQQLCWQWWCLVPRKDLVSCAAAVRWYRQKD